MKEESKFEFDRDEEEALSEFYAFHRSGWRDTLRKCRAAGEFPAVDGGTAAVLAGIREEKLERINDYIPLGCRTASGAREAAWQALCSRHILGGGGWKGPRNSGKKTGHNYEMIIRKKLFYISFVPGVARIGGAVFHATHSKSVITEEIVRAVIGREDEEEFADRTGVRFKEDKVAVRPVRPGAVEAYREYLAAFDTIERIAEHL